MDQTFGSTMAVLPTGSRAIRQVKWLYIVYSKEKTPYQTIRCLSVQLNLITATVYIQFKKKMKSQKTGFMSILDLRSAAAETQIVVFVVY